MVSEVVMYQSMFVLGIVMFGFFATSFNSYSNYAEAITLDNNLDRVLQEINQELLNMLNQASELRGSTGTISLTIKLALDANYAGEAYVIQPQISGIAVSLVALSNEKVISTLPIGLQDGTDFNLRQITFSGSSSSSSDNTGFTYSFNSGTGLETVTFF